MSLMWCMSVYANSPGLGKLQLQRQSITDANIYVYFRGNPVLL